MTKYRYRVLEKSFIDNELIDPIKLVPNVEDGGKTHTEVFVDKFVDYAGIPGPNLQPTCDGGRAMALKYKQSTIDSLAALNVAALATGPAK